MILLRDDISEICRLLTAGKVICYPTDTVWAVGCDVTQAESVVRISQIRKGGPDKGYVLLVSDIEMLKRYVPKIHPRIETLLVFHRRPLTIIYEKTTDLPSWVKAENGSAAIRVATDEFCQALIREFGKPLVSAPAALIDAPVPPTFGGISSEILGAVDYVVKYRQDDKTPHEPSAVAKLDRHLELQFLRE